MNIQIVRSILLGVFCLSTFNLAQAQSYPACGVNGTPLAAIGASSNNVNYTTLASCGAAKNQTACQGAYIWGSAVSGDQCVWYSQTCQRTNSSGATVFCQVTSN